MSTYRLELLSTAPDLYTSVVERSDENAGFDLFVAEDYVLRKGEVTLLQLGCKARMVRCHPDGSEEDVSYWLAPRSSIWKSGVTQANSIGVIDKSYRGTLMGAVVPINKPDGYWTHDVKSAPTYVWSDCGCSGSVTITRGQRLFQIVAPDMGHIREVRLVDTLPAPVGSVRGEGGFGSTGK